MNGRLRLREESGARFGLLKISAIWRDELLLIGLPANLSLSILGDSFREFDMNGGEFFSAGHAGSMAMTLGVEWVLGR